MVPPACVFAAQAVRGCPRCKNPRKAGADGGCNYERTSEHPIFSLFYKKINFLLQSGLLSDRILVL